MPPHRRELTHEARASWVTTSDGVRLAVEEAGAGRPVLLLHGLTATRRYVVHGSRTIERGGRRVIAYDSRGHGESGPAPSAQGYGYDRLADDAADVLDALGVARAAVVGQSMGAATAVALALRHRSLVESLVLITPAHRGAPSPDLDRWDRLADGLERGGPDGFLDALGDLALPERWESSVRQVIRQRVSRHLDRRATAAALRATPRTAAFDGMDALGEVDVPTLVVGSRDDADPDHPLRTAAAWAGAIPDARLIVENEGESPLAWRGGALSAAILAHIDRR